MHIESKELLVSANMADLFAKVSDFSRFAAVMPPEIQNWKADQDRCSFEIQGMANLAMKIEERREPDYVKIVSETPSPFPFVLEFCFGAQDNKVLSLVKMQLDVNPMLSMMLKSPLQNFVNMLNEQLKQRCENKPE